jgi:pilus assembly protein FimV
MRSTHLFLQEILPIDTSRGVVMFVKRSSLVLASLMALPSAAFALGLGDIRLLSPLNAPLDAEIELVDVTPEELQTLKAQIAPRETFTRYGLEWPVFLSSVQVKTTRNADGRQIIKLKSTDTITEPFITLLVEVKWARGVLVREYTMLLDPPVYTPGQSPAANAPVAAPTAGAGAHEGAIARSGQQVPPSQDTSSISPNPPGESAGAPSPPSPPRPTSAGAGSSASAASGSSHVVKRGETLSSIASSTSGSTANSAQTRSWMLAIYQANPAAFDKNMNLLRSGAVLRIPEGADVSAISPAEANGEIRRQYAAWRSSAAAAGSSPSAEPGHLRLVTPTESDAAGAGGSSAATKALQGRVKELETQLSESKRLLEMRNAELAQLQSRLEGAGKPAPTPTTPTPPVAATPPSAVTPAPAPPEQPPAAQAEAPATTPPPAREPAPSAEPTPTPAADATRAHRPRPAATTAEEGGSLFDTLKDYWWAIGLLVVALAGLFGLRAWRSRRQSEFDDSLGRLAVAGAASMDRGFAASGDTSPVRPLTAATDDGAFLVEESGTHERPRFPGGAAPTATAARHVSSDETISSETAINLDQGDPLAEADFHMAYGLYDQAADLIRIAISREPNRRDLKLKLLEVFFVWGNKEQFLHSARELADTRDQAAPGEWEKIVIMGKQLAPEDPLFSGGGAVSGATAGGVDLDLEGGESRVDFDLLGEPVPGHSDGVDLDIGSALGDTTHDVTEAATDRNFIENTFAGASTGTTRQMTQKISRESDSVMPEFGAESEGPTVEQPQLSNQENPTIRQKVAMALKQGQNAEQTAELAIDDLGLDLGALDTVDQPGLGASPDAPTLVAGMDERSRKVMEEAQHRAQTEEPDTAATAAWRMDDSDLHAVLGNGANGQADNSQFDPSSTARLAALSDRDVDFDLGDVDADGVGEADADGVHHQAHGSNGAGLDLDVGTATVPDTAFTATQKLASDDLALPDLEPVTMSEVGTKLDLARAYMDMGDPEGARNILEEVMHEGSVAQKQEAQRLLESLPG